jgi:hypothetical protein
MMSDPEFFECELLTVPHDLAQRAAFELSGCEACSETLKSHSIGFSSK